MAFVAQDAARLKGGRLELALWMAAAVCAGVWGSQRVQAVAALQTASSIAPREENSRGSIPAGDEVIGRLEIRALGLSVPMMRNYDAGSLVRGVGHVPGTAVPGGLGNLVLAGHRDTFFRPLRNIRAGMAIQVIDQRGVWAYQVDRTEVVRPEQTEILEIGARPEMTLITCYPFNFIGSAPQRFIVHAHLVSADAS